MQKAFIILTVLFGFSRALGQQPSPSPQTQPPTLGPVSDEDAMALAARTAEATMKWDQSSSPGMKAEVQLIRKGEVQGHMGFEYHVKVSGAPHNQPYTLMGWPVTSPGVIAMMEGLAIAQDGTVGCPAGSTSNCAQLFKGTELRLTYAPSKGEIYRHALVSQDHQSRIFFSFVPDPILASDKACRLEVVSLRAQFGLVIIRGKGFQPGEELHVHTQSYQEIHDLPAKADPQGEFQAYLTPFVKGRTAGTTEVVVTGKSCSPTISFNWGEQP